MSKSAIFKRNLKPWQLLLISVGLFVVEFPFTEHGPYPSDVIAVPLLILGITFLVDAITTKIQSYSISD